MMGRAACSGCCQESAMLLGDAQSFFRAPIRDGPGSSTNTHTHISHVCWLSWWKINKANAPRNNQDEAAKQVLMQKQTEHKFKVPLHHPGLGAASPQRRRRRNNLFISLHTSTNTPPLEEMCLVGECVLVVALQQTLEVLACNFCKPGWK